METAVNIIKQATKNTSMKLFNSEKAITFKSGYTSTIIAELTVLTNNGNKTPYPLIAMFTELVTEKTDGGLLEFNIPKIAICCRTIDGLSEAQRLEHNFKEILYPIFEEFQNQLQKIDLGYDLILQRSDVAYYTESNSKSGKFNDMIDAIIVKNTKIKTTLNKC